MKKLTLLIAIMAATAALVCPANDGTATDGLPLPAIPARLHTPSERAAYLIEHFWDAMDFTDTIRSRDEAFMTQNFVNFLSVFPHAADSARRTASRNLLVAAAADSPASATLEQIITTYLYEPGSPMYNEEYYITFLEEGISAGVYDRDIAGRRLEMACKNRVGTPAANFAYTSRDGSPLTLYDSPATPSVLILFDPDCDHCTEVMEQLAADSHINSLIDAGRLSVTAIDIAGDDAMWNKTKNKLPANWTAGTDHGSIDEAGIYVFQSMPSIYLLAGDRTVILKNPSVDALLTRLSLLQ